MKKMMMYLVVVVSIIFVAGSFFAGYLVGYQHGKPDPRDFKVAINVGRVLGAAEADAKISGRFTAAYPWGVEQKLLKNPVNPFTKAEADITPLMGETAPAGSMSYLAEPSGDNCVVMARISHGEIIGDYSKLR